MRIAELNRIANNPIAQQYQGVPIVARPRIRTLGYRRDRFGNRFGWTSPTEFRVYLKLYQDTAGRRFFYPPDGQGRFLYFQIFETPSGVVLKSRDAAVLLIQSPEGLFYWRENYFGQIIKFYLGGV